MRNFWFSTSLAIALLGLHASAAEPLTGAAAFAQLGKLVGTWSGHTAQGRAYTVSFRYTAADSVLVETWALASGRESMTLYALDGERLLATHYCPQGNQPRLAFDGVDTTGRLGFRFVDGANLHVSGRSHQQAFWIKFDADGAFERGETYVDNDAPSSGPAEAGEAVRYTRVEPKP